MHKQVKLCETSVLRHVQVLRMVHEHMDFDTFMIATERKVLPSNRERYFKQYKIALATGLTNLSLENQKKIVRWALRSIDQSTSDLW